MFDPERLLGGMLKQGLRHGLRGNRRRSLTSNLLGGGLSTVAAVGAIGVAIAAFEHFTKKGPSAPPPSPSSGSGVPPPPPASPPAAPPADLLTSGTAESEEEVLAAGDRALLLLQAMIAAANADGEIDEDEQAGIIAQMNSADTTDADRTFLQGQLESPPSIDSLIPQIDSHELAVQVYAVSLAAIELDTKAERDYLKYLSMRLDLDDATVAELHERFGPHHRPKSS